MKPTPRVLGTDQRRAAAFLAVMVPIVVILIMGWEHRWIADDGFINFRYVDQIKHGNGPVFNARERVEAFTSPAWLALLLGILSPDGLPAPRGSGSRRARAL